MSDVPMSRDAKLITARDLHEANVERIARLAEQGVVVPDIAFIGVRFEALCRLLLDDDGLADLELAYERRLDHDLDEAEGPALKAQRRATLLHAVQNEAGRRTSGDGGGIIRP